MSKFPLPAGTICKGSFALGTGCGECESCETERKTLRPRFRCTRCGLGEIQARAQRCNRGPCPMTPVGAGITRTVSVARPVPPHLTIFGARAANIPSMRASALGDLAQKLVAEGLVVFESVQVDGKSVLRAGITAVTPGRVFSDGVVGE